MQDNRDVIQKLIAENNGLKQQVNSLKQMVEAKEAKINSYQALVEHCECDREVNSTTKAQLADLENRHCFLKGEHDNLKIQHGATSEALKASVTEINTLKQQAN
jgi:chromosome segregation ATPase